MDVVRFSIVLLNVVAFGAICVTSAFLGRRETSTRVRRLWLVIGLVSGALVLGTLQRLLIQAGALGWVSSEVEDSLRTDWQVAQSFLVFFLAMGSFISIKRLADSMAASERIAGTILDRVSHVQPETLELTPREREVLDTIGSGLTSDAELSAVLHISASTVQTHVKSLLRKAGVSRRQDLLAVAYLVYAHESDLGGAAPASGEHRRRR